MLKLPNELILIIFQILGIYKCRRIRLTCKIFYLNYKKILKLYLNDLQDFNPNKYKFYDKNNKISYQYNRIIITRNNKYIEFEKRV